MLLSLIVAWIFCGCLTILIVYAWARRTFLLPEFLYYLFIGPVYLLGLAFLWTAGHFVLSKTSTAGPLHETAVVPVHREQVG